MKDEDLIKIDREIAEIIAFERTGRYSTDVDDKGDHYVVHFGLSESMIIPKLAIEAGLFKHRSLAEKKRSSIQKTWTEIEEECNAARDALIRELSLPELFRIHSGRELGLIEVEFLKRMSEGFPVTCDRKGRCHGENTCPICGDVSETCEKPNCEIHPFKVSIPLNAVVPPGGTTTIKNTAMGFMKPIRFEVEESCAEQFTIEAFLIGNQIQLSKGSGIQKLPAKNFTRRESLKTEFDRLLPGIGVSLTVSNRDGVDSHPFFSRLVGVDLDRVEINSVYGKIGHGG